MLIFLADPQIKQYLRLATFTISSIFLTNSALAQIVSDETADSQITKVGTQHIITGGKQLGANLFHSFSQFSVPNSNVAYFNNHLDVNNIFTRITGGSISNIDGLIQANGNANLFFLNPAGIIFGPNTQLNLGGSFFATTAEAVIFNDGIQYNTIANKVEPLLSINAPIGLQYGYSPGDIISNSLPEQNLNLTIAPHNTLALLGGSILLQGTTIDAPSSSVEIGSVAEPKVVGLKASNYGWQIDYQEIERFGQIEITNQSLIDTSVAGGVVKLQGQDIVLSQGSNIINFTLSDQDGGDINLVATNFVKLDNSFLLNQAGRELGKIVKGNGGNIIISAPKVSILNNSIVSAGSFSEGNSGNITINARDFIELSNNNQSNFSLLSTSVEGNGPGGTINLNTSSLKLLNGGRIESSTYGQGQAGKIIINAAKDIELSGTNTFTFDNGIVLNFNSGLFASSGRESQSSELQSTGRSGNLIVNTPKLLIEKGAEISVSSFGREDAGDIEINVEQLQLANNGNISANTASGLGGSINLTANNVMLQPGSKISTNAGRNGDGGNINVVTKNLVLFDQTKISADAQAGTGGNILIKTQGLFLSPQSSITASSNLGTNGVVKLITPETDSNIDTVVVQPIPLKAEDLIYTGCSLGSDFAANEFRNIGRGGLPPSPIEEIVSIEALGDLGTNQSISTSKVINQNPTIKSLMRSQPIIEANSWMINQQGKIELVINNFNSFQLSPNNCQLNRSSN